MFTEEEYDNILEFYTSADTRRYHNKRDIPIQTVKEHSFGMLLLLLKLHPNPSANLMRAIVEHDLPETDGYFCDIPHDLKEEYPVFREIEAKVEAKFRSKFGLPENRLTYDERFWLKYLDGLEVLCYLDANLPEKKRQGYKIYGRQKLETEKLFDRLQCLGYFQKPTATVN